MTAPTLTASLLIATALAAAPLSSQARPSERHVHRESGIRRLDEGAPAERVAAQRRRRGVWPIANGSVFAWIGLGDPANRMFGITGPHYQTRRNHEPLGAFGEQWIDVLRGGNAIDASKERRWGRLGAGAATFVTEQFVDNSELRIEDRALVDLPVLVRRVRWRPAPDSGRVTLAVRLSREPERAQLAQRGFEKTYPRAPDVTYALRIEVLPGPDGARVEPGEDGFLVAPLAGAHETVFDVVLATGRSRAAARALAADLRDRTTRDTALAESDAARAEHELRFVRAEPAYGRIDRMLVAVQTLTEAQRALPGGAVGPLVHFKGVWLRDSNGPLKTFLWSGQFDRARDLLRYYRAASALHGATHREFPLDLAVDDVAALTAEQWAKTGTDRCEVPSFVVLQHLWYYDHTGDADLIRDHYPWLRRNAVHQVFREGPHGPLQPFNGDETYLHGAFYSLFPGRDVWPNSFPRAAASSLDSSWVYVAAQRAMQRLCVVADAAQDAEDYARRADQMTASIEQHFWMPDRGYYAPALAPWTHQQHEAPYAPINFGMAFVEIEGWDRERLHANFRASAAMLGRADGLAQMTPSVAHYIGSLPGYYLDALARFDEPRAWQSFEAMLDSASPSGAWAEVHEPTSPGHGYGDGRYPNRLRPWESGLNLDAALRFLTGATIRDGRTVRLHPRHPDRSVVESIGPLRVGETRFRLEYPRRDADDARAVVRWLSGPAITVEGETLSVDRPELRVATAGPAEVEPIARRAFHWDLRLPPGTRRLVLTTEPHASADPRGGDYVLDAGLPFSPVELAYELLDDDGEPAIEELVLHPSAQRVDRETMKPERFWGDPILQRTLEQFRAHGGRVDEPRFLTTWWIAGPFPNPESRGLLTEDRPVTAPFDDRRAFRHSDGVARWRKVTRRDGRIDLHSEDGPHDHVCAFARTVIDSAEDEDALLKLGTDDGCRVWLNGALVFESIEARALRPDQFAIPVTLRAGKNVLTIGVEDRDGGFELQARIVRGRR